MGDQRRRPRAVEAYEHYYAVSVAFTKDHVLRMALTTFHFNPRSVVSEALGWEKLGHYSADLASSWLSHATDLAVRQISPELPDIDPVRERQLRLF